MFYPPNYRCRSVGVAGGAARCNMDAARSSGFCLEHASGECELPPLPSLILFKANIKEGSGVWMALTAAGIKVEERSPNYDAALNEARTAEEVFRKGVAFHERIQRVGGERQADTGVPIFGVGGHKGPLNVSGVIGELGEAGYLVVGCHILLRPGKPPVLVVALIFGGKPEEGFDWGKVAPIVERLWKGFSFGVNLWVNPPPADKPERGVTHTINLFGKNDVPPEWILRWNDRSWGLEPVAKTVLAPAPAQTQTINNNETPSA